MLSKLFLSCVVALKVFKKSSPNGNLTVYLGKRDFCDYVSHCDVIDGVVIVDDDYLKERKVYGQIITTYRFGREQDEVMGIKFSRDLFLVSEQVVPTIKKIVTTDLQERLIRRFGSSSCHAFIFELPKNAPASIILKPGAEDMDKNKPLGVEYSLKIYAAENEVERPHKRSTVSLAVRKIQCASFNHTFRQPSTLINKGFTMSAGRLQVEVNLDKDLYHHGEEIIANLSITNMSKKSVRYIKLLIVQHVEVTIAGAQFSRVVGLARSKEGCPVTPGASLTKCLKVTPDNDYRSAKRGTALDGPIKFEETNLASSTMISSGTTNSEGTGILVSYFVKVNLYLGPLNGDAEVELPVAIVHPFPEKSVAPPLDRSKKRLALSKMGMSTDFVFEDFARRQNSEEL